MNVVEQLEDFQSKLKIILSRFKDYSINSDDDPIYRQIIIEIIDFLNDQIGSNQYSSMIANHFNEGISNYYSTPSFKSVENIIGVLGAAINRFKRSPQILDRRKEIMDSKLKQNIFIIHGRDEAKWREIKDVLQNDLRLNPIVLLEQANKGKTLIEKFEHYAKTCSYAVAVFTPDDEVKSKDGIYLQARPNVIYELGWFCGHLGREHVMLLLKEGTTVFSDFDGIVQVRFKNNVSEKLNEIKKDLVETNILDKI